jgi:hypothetical protein
MHAVRKKTFLWKQCDEVVLGLRVDPEHIRSVVEPEFSMALDDGEARVVIMAQDCSQYWLDGEKLEPTQPVVGTQRTMPTMNWFALFTGSTNARDRERRAASRVSTGPIEGISLERTEVGSVTVGDDQRYSWRLPVADGPIRVLGFNHEIYSRDDAGGLAFKRVQAIVRMVGDPVSGTLKAPHGVDPGGWVAPGTYPVRAFTLLPAWARATLGEDPPDGRPAATV